MLRKEISRSANFLGFWWVVKPKWDDRLWGPGNLDSHTEVRREPQTRRLYQAHEGPGNLDSLHALSKALSDPAKIKSPK